MSIICEVRAHLPEELRELAGQPGWPLRFCGPGGTYFLAPDAMAQARARGIEMEVLREIQERELPVHFELPHQGAVCDPPPEDARLSVLARLLSECRADGSVNIRFLGRNRAVPADGFALDRSDGQRRYVWQVVDAGESPSSLDERFRALRELCAAEDSRVVLSLGSGGLKLFAHATALRLIEAIGCAEHVQEIWGSSAGAMAGLMYAQGLSPHAIEQLGYDLYAGRVDLGLRPSKFQLVRRLVTDALLPVTGGTPPGFVDCAKGLERVLEQYCAAVKPRLPFFCPAFNVGDCRPEVLTPIEVPQHLADFMIQTDPREAALASSTVPLLFVPRVIRRGDRELHYIDGSTTEDVPLHSIALKWDRDREAGTEERKRLVILYVKLTGSLHAYETHPRRIGKLRLLQTVAAAGIETMHRRDLELLDQRTDVTLLPLELGDSSPDFFETGLIPEYVSKAKETFPEQLMALESQLRQSRRTSSAA